MLDPTKVGILAPGMGDDGTLGPWGVPAPLLTAYLGRHGIVPSRSTDHIVLCLFSVGITRGKWGTLLNALLAFKRDWDANAPLLLFFPQLFQGIFMAMLFVPLTTITMDAIRKEEMGNATSMFNLMRNLGGSVGIACGTTFLFRRQQFHRGIE